MQAIELVEDRESKAPAVQATAALMEAARENRLLIGKGGTHGNVIRISAPAQHFRKAMSTIFALRLTASLERVSQARLTGAAV